MNDLSLLLFGCIVSFIAVGGAYVYIRMAFERGTREEKRAAAPPGARLREARAGMPRTR